MPDPLLLYSTNTWLAYRIAQAYYGEKHYVWCAPYFSPNAVPAQDYAIPPSASPSEIYLSLYEDIKRGDRHSTKIEANKAGILRGANAKEKEGIINKDQRLDIYAIAKIAELNDFRPLVYIIPYYAVKELVEKVPVKERAHPLSDEYRIRSLPRECFDVMEFYKR